MRPTGKKKAATSVMSPGYSVRSVPDPPWITWTTMAPKASLTSGQSSLLRVPKCLGRRRTHDEAGEPGLAESHDVTLSAFFDSKGRHGWTS